MAAGTLEILLGISALLIFIYYYWTAKFNYWKSRGINGPKPIPFFGNVADIFFGRICFGSYLKKIYDRYPQEPMVGLYLRGEPALIIQHSRYIKEVLIKNFSVFPERHWKVYEKAEPLSVHLFRLESARWRPLRARLSPVFTSAKLKDMFHLLLECSEHFERRLSELIPANGIVELRTLTSKFTIDMIGSCAFGIEMNALNAKDSEFHRMGQKIFTANFRKMLTDRVRDNLPWVYKHYGHLIKDGEATRFMTNVIKNNIEYRKKNNVRRHDYLDMLIGLKDHPEKLGVNEIDDTFIAAQSYGFFGAGFETSSTTISNALYELALNPSIQERTRRDIGEVLEDTNGAISYDSIKKMSYLDKVFHETLRKYPPVMFLMRETIANYTFEGTDLTVPKGQKVFIPVYAIQHDPKLYPQPDRFDPERFDEETVKSRDPMYYLPFGDGPRNCIGARFGVYQVKMGLIKVLLNYKVDVCEQTQIPYVIGRKQAILLHPERGLYVKFTKLA